MKAIDLLGLLLIIFVIFSATGLWAIWLYGYTLGAQWECTKWHIEGTKDYQSSKCDQYTRKESSK